MRNWIPTGGRLAIVMVAFATIVASCTGDAATTTTTSPGDDAPTTTQGTEETTPTTEGEPEPPTTASTLRMSISQDESTLTPFTHVSSPPFLDLVWDSLLISDSDNQLHPLVASELEVSEDRLTFTMKIREGQTWHDGEPLTVDDVVFTFDYQAENGFLPGQFSIIESVEAVDDSTVVIQLSETAADFERDMLATIDMIPEHIFSNVEDPRTAGIEVAIGSGPYMISEYAPDELYVLTANPNYAMGTPKLETIIMPIIPQASTAFAALRSGEIDMVSAPLETQLIDQFEAAPDLAILRGSNFSPELLVFNAERPPFDQPEIRKAIAMAIDTDELIEVVALGIATPPNAGFLHPESPLTTSPIPHEFDPAGARAALDAAGATLGDDGVRTINGERMSFTLLVESTRPNTVRVTELVSGMLGDVGIEVAVEALEPLTLYSSVWPEFNVANGRDFDMSMFNWQPVLSIRAGRFGGLVHSDPVRGTLNIGGFSDAETDELVATLDTAPTSEERLAAIQSIAENIAELVPFVTLYYPDTAFAYRPGAFDGWEYRKGLGPVDPNSFVDFNDW